MRKRDLHPRSFAGLARDCQFRSMQSSHSLNQQKAQPQALLFIALTVELLERSYLINLLRGHASTLVGNNQFPVVA